jgi:DUF917 family protein
MLGAGGGGDTYTGLLMALRAVGEHGPVAVAPLDQIAPDAVVMACGLVGSPAVADERLWSGDEGAVLADAIAELRGAAVDAVMCFQIGGANGLLPVTWAARLGLPLVDADGMGRAFPGLRHQAMRVAGIPASPVVLTDGRGDTVVVRAADDTAAERLALRATASFGGVCAGAVYCMTGAEARRAAIGGSVSRAVQLGGDDGVAGREPLFEGRVVDMDRDSSGAAVRGSATLAGAAGDSGRQLRLELQDEFLLAIEDGAVRAAVPDAICVLGAESGEPVSTEALGYGDRVTVVAWPAPAVWRSPAGLAIAGPRAFGYDVDYEPIAVEVADARR